MSKGQKKILWIHNFPKNSSGGGFWMYNQFEYIKEDVDLYFLKNLRNPLYFFLHVIKLYFLSKKYEILHAQYGSAVGFLVSLMPGRKILSLKGSDWYKAPNPRVIDKFRIFLGGLLTRFSLNRFESIIVMSERMRKEVESIYKNKNIYVIVDPIDLKQFKPEPKIENSNIKKVLFASVSVDNPIKRYSLAKESFDFLKTKMSNVEFVSMSNIPHSKVCSFMNNVDVLLITSTHEGWPNVVKEVLACNIPFVGTDVSDLKQVADKTNNCFVCESATPEKLGEALYKSLNSDKENLRELVSMFEMKTIMNKLKDVYES
ncbi:glycosyltransferase [Galbibacter sp. BG1]